MSGESPVVELYDSNGTPLSVQNGSAIPASTPGLLLMGSDGTNSRYFAVDSSGRTVVVGAGTAGTPVGGVISIQGVASGTVVPISITGTNTISGTVTANQGTANTIGNSWPVEITDGINILGTATHPVRIDPTGTTTQPVSGTVSISGTVGVTQSTSPWVTNITQFGGNNVITGTGASGLGIPRVTISNDSNILATQSGTWTVQQGSPPWTVSQATASNLNATVVGLGTAGSPSGGILSTQVPDTTNSGTLNALNATASIALNGSQGVGMQLAAGTLQGTIVPEISYDGGTTWVASFFVDPTTSNVVSSIVFGSNNAATARTIVAPAGASNARVRVSIFTSGTANCNVRATSIVEPPVLSSGAAGATAPPSIVQIGGNDGTNLRAMLTDASGHPIIVGDGVAGTPAGGVVSIQGVSGGTTVPVSGTVAVTQSTSPWVANITQFGSNNVVTGTGASGLGIPRVTVSNDSNILATQSGSWTVTATQATAANLRAQTASESTTATATGTVAALVGGAVTTAAPTYSTGQMDPFSLTTAGALRVDGSGVTQPVSGTVTANQGTANTLANKWPVQVTDGTNTMPTGDVASRAIFEKITDGTNTATVKAASTAPTATDTALVVAVSPNSFVATSSTSTRTSVAASVTAVTLLASNTSRRGATVFNDSATATLKVGLGSSVTSTDFTVLLTSNGYYEVPFGYTGIITGIWSLATGNARITELT
jgi:hypothetical protein